MDAWRNQFGQAPNDIEMLDSNSTSFIEKRIKIELLGDDPDDIRNTAVSPSSSDASSVIAVPVVRATKNIRTPKYCSCQMTREENDDKLIKCEVCFERFHYKCVGYGSGPFTCSLCMV